MNLIHKIFGKLNKEENNYLTLDERIKKLSEKKYLIETPSGKGIITLKNFSLNLKSDLKGVTYDFSYKGDKIIEELIPTHVGDFGSYSLYGHKKCTYEFNKDCFKGYFRRVLKSLFPEEVLEDILDLHFLQKERENFPLNFNKVERR